MTTEHDTSWMWRDLTPCELEGYLTKRLMAFRTITEGAKPSGKKCSCPTCGCLPRLQFQVDHQYQEVTTLLEVYRYNLIQRMPEDLREWQCLRETIDEVLATGHISMSDPKYVGKHFPRLRDLRAAMARLNQAWQGLITVTVPRPVLKGSWQIYVRIVRHHEFDWKAWERKLARERELEPAVAN